MAIKYSLAILVSLFITNSVSGLTIYVSTLGKDSNPGTVNLPLATIFGAQKRVREIKATVGIKESITVVIKGGNYYLTSPMLFKPEDSGTEKYPITYAGESANRPAFLGGMKIKLIKTAAGNWEAKDLNTKTVLSGIEQLYINGKTAVRARQPNNRLYKVSSVSEILSSDNKDGVQTIKLDKEQFDYFKNLTSKDLQTAVITFYHRWDITRRNIDKFNLLDSTFTVKGSKMKSWNRIDSTASYCVENIKSAMDHPGEWFYSKSGILTYIPLSNEKANIESAFIPKLEYLMAISGYTDQKVSSLTFKDISFRVSGFIMPTKGLDPNQAAANTEAAIRLDQCESIHFQNCEVANTGTSGIWLRKNATNVKIEQCYIHEIGASAIKIGDIKQTSDPITRNNTVDNNIIKRGGLVFPCAAALIIFNSSENEISHNDISDFVYTGISVGWVWGYEESPSKRNLIEYNHIHYLGWGLLSDMGGVYTLGKSEGTIIRNNIIDHIVSKGYGGWGLYTDEGSTGITIENNLVYKTKSSAFHQHYGKDNVIQNNIFYDQGLAQLEATKVEDHSGFSFTKNIIVYKTGNLFGINWLKANFASDYNAYWDLGGDADKQEKEISQLRNAGKDVHSVLLNPNFADPDNMDFKIKNKKVLTGIKFKTFDISKAGVYGSSNWLALAIVKTSTTRDFENLKIK